MTEKEKAEILSKANKMIYVYMDTEKVFLNNEPILLFSHNGVIKQMKKGIAFIHTHVPSFFCFDTLKEGYDVTVYYGVKKIILSELLTKQGKYTDKEIRWEHNAYKLLMADALGAIK